MKQIFGFLSVALVVAACSGRPLPDTGKGPETAPPPATPPRGTSSEIGNGGTFLPILFKAGQTYALQLISRVNIAYSRRKMALDHSNWLDSEHRRLLTTALSTSEHHWAKELPPECPHEHKCACHIKGKDLYFSYDGCARITDVKGAGATLIHEAVHQIINTPKEEETANEVAALYMSTWLGMGHPDAVQWQGIDEIVHSEYWTDFRLFGASEHYYFARGRLIHFGETKARLYDPKHHVAFDMPYGVVSPAWDVDAQTVQKRGVVLEDQIAFFRECHNSWRSEFGGGFFGLKRGSETTGMAYSLDNFTWTNFPKSKNLLERKQVQLRASGKKMIVWGGRTCVGDSLLSGGTVYDSRTQHWSSLPPLPESPERVGATVDVHKGKLIVWGGTANGEVLSSGAVFDFDLGAWRKMATENAPTPRCHAESVSTDRGLFVYGGYKAARERPEDAPWITQLAHIHRNGGIYDVEKNEWILTDASNEGPPGIVSQPGHALVWNGVQVLVITVRELSFYNPYLNEWKTSVGLVQPFLNNVDFQAFWTGFEVIGVVNNLAYSLIP